MKKTLLLLLAASSFSLAALSCAGTSVSAACTTDRDCEPGQGCFTNFPGGFCTRGCTREAEVGVECPGSAICTRTVAASGALFCSTPCTDNAQCREGYTCLSLSGTDKKACAP